MPFLWIKCPAAAVQAGPPTGPPIHLYTCSLSIAHENVSILSGLELKQ